MRSVDELRVLSQLLDQALELPPAEREPWLRRLQGQEPEMALTLRGMLERSQDTHDPLMSETAFTAVGLGGQVNGFAAGCTVGPYRLLRELGRGGMGEVWLAERIDRQLRRPVALKLLAPGLRRSVLVERFARERDILAGLVHPHIARLYDAGLAADGQPYMALEYVQGSSLTEYCDRHRLGTEQRLALAMQVLDAVQYAHTRLIIHRDLKPNNIHVTEDGQVRLLDFGVAKLLAEDDGSVIAPLTQIGSQAFTPDYASPEQVRGDALGTASDVYALGVVLYELLCGHRPYKLGHRSVAQLEQAILDAEPQPPSLRVDADVALRQGMSCRELQRRLRGELDTIVLKALKKRPEDRYATAAELSEDLRRQRNGEPVLARPDSFAYRARKYVGRNKLVAASAVAVVMALSGGLAIATWQYRLAAEEARIARDEAKTSAAVQAFMQNLFTAESVDDANPENAATIRAGQLLASAVEQAKSAMTETPRARVKMLVMLSQLYLERRMLEQALETGRLAVDTASQLEPLGLEMADSLKAYSMALDFSYRFEEAMAAMRRRLQILRNLKPDDHALQLDAEMSLGGLLVHVNPSQALPHLQAAVALARALHNDKELVTALFYEANALNRGTTNDPVQARAAALESLQVAARLKGTPEGRVVGVRELPQYQELSSAAIALDDPDEALRYARLGFEGASKFHLPGDALARRHSANLARALLASGQPLTAIDFLDRTWHLSDPAQSDPPVLEQTMVLSAYQQAQVAAGRVEDALATFDRIVALGRRVRMQPDWPAAFQGSRAAALIELGQVEAAMTSIEAASDSTQASGIKSEFLLPLLADVDLAHGDTSSLRARVAAFRRGRQGPLSLRSQWLLDDPLAEAALKEHQFGEAEALAGSMLERIEKYDQRGAVADVEANALWVRARAQLARGHAADAVVTMHNAVALFERVVDTRLSLRLADMFETLARAKVGAGDRAGSVPLVQLADEICRRHRGSALHRMPELESPEAHACLRV